jgi:hypothetical protein
MSDPENFLSRWSRRKREVADETEAQTPAPSKESTAGPSPEAGRTPGETAAAPASAGTTNEPPFDLTSLPSIDSITAETDIRAFLAAGVPPALTRAALRRVWVADPAIKNFVGLADYDWDFHTPGAIAGFGPLEMDADELRRQVLRIVGQVTEPKAKETADLAQSDPQPVQITGESASENPAAPSAAASIAEEESQKSADVCSPGDPPVQRNKDDAALQHAPQKADRPNEAERPTRGRALPT